MTRRFWDSVRCRLAAARHRRLAVTLVLAAAILAAWFGSGIWFQKDIAIIADGAVMELRISAFTVAQALEAAGVVLGPWDRVAPDLGARLASGDVIEVRRARPVVFAFADLRMRVNTAAETVGDVLATSRVPVDQDDRLEPGLDTPVVPGMVVNVTRVVSTYHHRLDPVPFEVVKREDTTMDIGQNVVVQPGEPGQVARLVRVTYEDGVKTAEEELSRQTLQEPVPKIMRVGTAGTVVRDGQTIRFLKSMTVTATAYEPGPISCGAWADGYTAVGLRATRGIIAVDPRVIPLWSKVYVDGYGFAVAGDVGSAIKGSRIDVCYDTYDEAIRWGVRRVKIYILELPES